MSQKYAILDDKNVVTNVGLAESDSVAQDIWGTSAIRVPNNTVLGVGWTRNVDGTYTAPAPTPPTPDPGADAINTMMTELNAATTVVQVKAALTKGLGKAIRPDKF